MGSGHKGERSFIICSFCVLQFPVGTCRSLVWLYFVSRKRKELSISQDLYRSGRTFGPILGNHNFDWSERVKNGLSGIVERRKRGGKGAV